MDTEEIDVTLIRPVPPFCLLPGVWPQICLSFTSLNINHVVRQTQRRPLAKLISDPS